MNEGIARVQRVVNPLVRSLKGATYKCPLPVWDSTGEMIGVAIEAPVVMGGVACNVNASFAVKARDDEASIRVKAEAAIAAVKSEVVVTIRPVRAKKTA